MKVGLFISTQFQPGESVAGRVPDLLAQVRTARDAGFASLLLPHHYLTAPMQMLQIAPAMAYLMREAEGMLVGPGIVILPLLNPVHVAEEAATFDVLSGGNYVLGVGLGYRDPEFDAFGIPLGERAARFSESIGLMRRLWTEDRVTHAGKFFQVKDAGIGLKPVRPGGPPIWIAAQADPAIRRAARIGDAWLIVPSASLGEIGRQVATYRAALAEAGRTPACLPIERECYVGASHKTALEECRGPLEYKYAAYASWGLGGSTQMPFDQFVRDRFIIGDAAFVKDEVARYQAALGADHFVMRVQWPGLSQEQALGSIRRLGQVFA
ncbi:MAG: LLM class flavin-dependent oxidoreductase [Rhodospirillales bacterium]|jgi:alkanesulfonate monooxygenase SsuD/methylene tetrahydromethanopterin reductase-like flavin-dependent oxidoreductase (luciferase family)|nr:LLM class flavin-dependent oxidoreductase [Rhodospirillales bacterium]